MLVVVFWFTCLFCHLLLLIQWPLLIMIDQFFSFFDYFVFFVVWFLPFLLWMSAIITNWHNRFRMLVFVKALAQWICTSSLSMKFSVWSPLFSFCFRFFFGEITWTIYWLSSHTGQWLTTYLTCLSIHYLFNLLQTTKR